MDPLREYILRIFAVSLICSGALSMVRSPGMKDLLRLVCGLIITVTVAAPLADGDLHLASVPGETISRAARDAAAEGETLYRQALAACIKEEAEAYILDKAEALGTQISVEVILSDGDPPVPEAAEFSGHATLQQKQALQDFLLTRLGIAKERQTWTG